MAEGGSGVAATSDGPLMQALEGRSTHRQEVILTCLDGTKQPIYIDASPLRNAQGDVVAACLSCKTWTEKRKIKADFEDRVLRLISTGLNWRRALTAKVTGGSATGIRAAPFAIGD